MKLHIPTGVDLLPQLPRRTYLLIVGTYAAVATFVGLWLRQGWGGPFATRVVDDVASLTGILFAAGCAVSAARASNGRVRSGWFAMAAGLLTWAVGEFIWGFYEIGLRYVQAPFPSVADAAYLLFPVGAGAAVLLLAPSDRGQSRKRLLLDGVIVAVSVFLVWWMTVLDRVFAEGGETTLALAVSLAYPLTDIVIITIAWTRAVAAYRPSFGMLVGGLVVIAVSDSIFAAMTTAGSYRTGALVDLGWMIGCGLLGFGALKSIGEPPVDPTMSPISSQVRLWGPYLPLVLACGVGLAEAVPNLSSVPLAFASGLLVAVVLVRQVIALSENRRLLADVARLAFRDQLTGLANRALFLDRLDQAVARLPRDNEPFAVLCLDLDDFKMVNDKLGHPAGDELLMRVGQRITECLRNTDTVARLGGDEFAMLISGSAEHALVAAQRILDRFTEPIVIDGVSLSVRPSLGMTIAPPEATATTADDLLRHADLAMYAAKRDGGGCLRSFAPDLPRPFELPDTVSAGADGAQDVASRPQAPADEPDGRGTALLSRRPWWPPIGIRWALGVLTVGVAGFGVATVFGVRPDETPARGWFQPLLLLGAAALVAIRVYRVPYERWAWASIATGMAAAGVGGVVFDPMAQGQWHSIADPVYLVFYPAVYVSLLLLVRGQLGYIPTPIRMDGIVVALTASAVGAVLVGPFSADGKPLAAVVVSLAYPIGGVLLLTLATESATIIGWRAEARWALFTIGSVLWVLAAVAYLIEPVWGSTLGVTWMHACWPAAFLLVAVASWLPQRHVVARPRIGATPLVAPLVCIFIALAVAIFAFGERLPVALAAFSLTAIAARYALTFRDASAVAESHEHAMTDELTGLANRRALAIALTAEPTAAQRSSTMEMAPARLALLVIDVEEFEEINKAFHEDVRDGLLCGIAARLTRTVRPQDLVAHTTGRDDFAILLADDVNLMTARAMAGSILDALRPPFVFDHLALQIDVNIVIAMWPEHCAHPQELLTLAEAAMPGAKTARKRIAVYDPAAVTDKGIDAQLVKDLRMVLFRPETDEAGELICHYQPKISAADDHVHSVEALVRWRHPAQGLLYPDQFLSAAERTGLMRPVATRVLDIALAQIRRWRDHGLVTTVAVNLSASNLLDVGLVDTIDQLLQTHRLPADALILEITEGTLATDSQRSRNTVAALRRLGIRISLDDYGTGWSSLARLQDLSVDELKLDRVFVARLARDARSIAIVRSTVALASSLEADLVAEGVEDEATLHALRQYGCTITQGYVHTPALPAEGLYEWVINHQADITAQRPQQIGERGLR